ncbi:MAG: protein-L-isoaspartate O-methyltransferase, partial [Omnitrophica bacterium GWA2_52_8]
MRNTLLWFLIFAAGTFLIYENPAAPAAGHAPQETDFAMMRERMIEEQLRKRGISDPRVLEAIDSVLRHEFVPPHLQHRAYDDNPLPIDKGQTISQPYIVAYMTEALQLKPGDKVLEVGTGSGYQAAVLSRLAGEVYSVEIIPELAQQAAEKLETLGFTNITVKEGNGYEGWLEHAPFDAVIVTAAPNHIPEKLIEQLRDPGGRMIVPVGSHYQELVLLEKTPSGIRKKTL